MTDPIKKPAAKAKRPIRRLTVSQRAEAIALWQAGEITLDGLSKKFGKSRQAFMRLFDKEGIKKGSKSAETAKRVTDAVESGLVDSAAETAKRIRDTKEEHYRMSSTIAKLTWKLIADTQAKGEAIGTKLNDMKALQMASNVLKTVREERYAVLGLNEKVHDDDTPLPDLVIRELTAGQIESMQQTPEGDPDGDFDIDDMPDMGIVGQDDDEEI
jgi:predicted DNA-binding protein